MRTQNQTRVYTMQPILLSRCKCSVVRTYTVSFKVQTDSWSEHLQINTLTSEHIYELLTQSEQGFKYISHVVYLQ